MNFTSSRRLRRRSFWQAKLTQRLVKYRGISWLLTYSLVDFYIGVRMNFVKIAVHKNRVEMHPLPLRETVLGCMRIWGAAWQIERLACHGSAIVGRTIRDVVLYQEPSDRGCDYVRCALHRTFRKDISQPVCRRRLFQIRKRSLTSCHVNCLIIWLHLKQLRLIEGHADVKCITLRVRSPSVLFHLSLLGTLRAASDYLC